MDNKYINVRTDTNIHGYNDGTIIQSPLTEDERRKVGTVKWDIEHRNTSNSIPCYDHCRDRLIELLLHKYGVANSLKSNNGGWVKPVTEMFQYTKEIKNKDDRRVCWQYIKSWNFENFSNSSTLQILRLVEDLHLTRDVDSKSPGFCLEYVKTGYDEFEWAVNDKWGVTNQYGETLPEDRRLISNIYDISIYFDYIYYNKHKWVSTTEAPGSRNLSINCAIRFHKPGNTPKSCDFDYSYWHFPAKYHTPYDKYYGKISPIRNY